jgi:outer membrane receptor protein involved in Fe transport
MHLHTSLGGLRALRHVLPALLLGGLGAARAQTPSSPAVQQLEAVTVEATRTSGLVNQGIIPRDEYQAIAYTVIDRLEIERIGATDINELFRDLPQVSVMQTDTTMIAGTNGFLTFGGNTPTSRVDLRGFGNAGTTILVNGRRMPIVRETQGGGPDFTRLPLSAIERVEVLSGAAGGIYGSYTQGGVINIILRKEFTGRELSLNYGASLHGGAGEKRLTYTEGRGFRHGKSQLTWTLDAVVRDNMPFSDRPLYRRYLDHVAVPTDQASFTAWQASGGLNAFPSRPGIIVGRNAANQIAPLILPLSASTAVFASIPAGSNGTNLTPASFVTTANRYQPTEAYNGFALFSPSRRVSLNATYNHQIVPDRLNAYLELGFDYNRTYTDSPATPQTLSLTANDPRNPFRNGVTPGFVGQPVSFYYLPTDLPGTHRASENGTARVVLGINGKVNPFQRPWSWAFDVSADYNRRYSVGYLPMQMLSSLQSLGATRPLAAAYYTSVADHDAFPNAQAAGFLPTSSYRKNSDYVLMSNGVLRLNGETVNLPAGPVRNSFVGEWSIQTYENSFKNWYDDSFLVSLGGTPSTSSSPGKTERQDRRIGAELTVPIFGRKWSPFRLQHLELTYAVSRVDLPYLEPFTSAVYGLRVAPVRDVTFRASWQQGTIPFADSLVIGSERFTDIVGSTVRDPRRGNTFLGNFTQVSGPNFDLKPTETRTANFGLILQPRFAKGLNVTFDYAFTERINGNVVPTVAELLLYEDQYPGRIARVAPSAADAALGWLGQIQTVDLRRVNVGNLWSQTFDTSVRYTLPLSEVGTFDFTVRTAQTREFKQRQRPGQPIVDNLDTMNLNGTTVPKLRGSGSIQWRRKVWSASLAGRYTESFRDTLGAAVDDSLTFNLQASYEIPFEQQGARQGLRRFLSGTQWTLGVNNIFDFDPPYVQNPGNQGFPSFYSLFDDPRGRYVYVRIKKTF